MGFHTAPRTAKATCNVFVDFDGMVVPGDATDGLLARFADPSWREIEEQWQRGEIPSRECMARQVALLRATPAEIARFLETVRIDPHFPAFVRLCRSKGADVTVVSDGMDLIVGSVLRRAGLDVPFFANELQWLDEDRWTLRFPFARKDCAERMGNCKCAHRPLAGTAPSIMVGDGRSDFCIARGCAFVLAKGALAVYCRELGLPHAEVGNFADARRAFARWLRGRLPASGVNRKRTAQAKARLRLLPGLKTSP